MADEEKKIKDEASDEKKTDENNTDSKKTDEKKSESEDKKEEKSSKGKYFAVVVFGLILIGIGFLLISNAGPSENGRHTNTEVIAKALDVSGGAMAAAESANNMVILRSDALVSTTNGTMYLASFSTTGSANYTSFDVILDSDLNFVALGLDGSTVSDIDKFIAEQQGENVYQLCAKKFNEEAVIPQLISKWYNSTYQKTYMLDLPRTLNCGGAESTYSLEIGDGYVKTTVLGDGKSNFYTHRFTGATISKGVTIPAEDIEKGVFVYVTTTGPYELQYAYGLQANNPKPFDEYADDEVEKYNIKVVPAVVWNCDYLNGGTKASGELNGTFVPGSEELILKTFSCVFNKGLPEDLCSEIGIVRDENNTIKTQIPVEYYLTGYKTGLESCKPDEDTVRVDVFYTPDCPDCDNQRPILDKIAKEFGDSMDLNYYCVGDEKMCDLLIS